MTTEAEAEITRKEAADWFSKLNQRKVTTADIKAFSAWRREPKNARAFSRLEAMWDAAGTLAGSPAMTALADEAKDRADRTRSRRRTSSGRLIPLGLVTALVLATGAGGLSWWSLQRPAVYATAIGEQRILRLKDGSRIVLDTDSRVSVRFTRSRRLVTLAAGRAMFDVHGDAARPFLVEAGDTEVIAVGTRFDVRRSGNGARVVLVEGRVDVRKPASTDGAWSLAPGQTVTTSTPAPRVSLVDVPAETSWTLGRLTFQGTPIASAVAEMNRYTDTPIELRDRRVSSIQVSGAFNAGDIEGFIAALCDLYDLEATRAADGRIILSAPG